MKKYINFLMVLCTISVFTSCLVDDEAQNYSLNDQGPNLLGFTQATVNASVVTDGTETSIILPVQLAGPTASTFSGEFTAMIEVDPSSTAIEGVHYTLDSNTVTISSAQNLIANVPLTIITDGIDPPLDENPVLILNLTNVSDPSIVPNGRTASITVNIEYLCFSDITGKYRALEAKYFRIGVESGLSNPAYWPA